MTQRGFQKEKPGTKQAHFTTLPSSDVCLQSWVPWKVLLGFQGKEPWRDGFLSWGPVPPGTWLQEWELGLMAPFYTYGTALGWENIFFKDWKKSLKNNFGSWLMGVMHDLRGMRTVAKWSFWNAELLWFWIRALSFGSQRMGLLGPVKVIDLVLI